jgi:hypothetical protein
VKDPPPCELFNRDVASLMGANFGNKSPVFYVYCIYLALVNLEFVLCRSTYSSCCTCKIHCRSLLVSLLTLRFRQVLQFYVYF